MAAIDASGPVQPVAPTVPPRGSLKRSRDGDQTPSSPTKRHKVAFDPEPEIRYFKEKNEKGYDLVREEVRRAIQLHLNGDSTAYDELKSLITCKPDADDAPSSALLQKYFYALIGNVSLLHKGCSGLVNATIKCEWLLRDDSFVNIYQRYLGSLISAHGGYSSNVLRRLVEKFCRLPSSTSCHPDEVEVQQREMLDRTHVCLKYLLQLVPTASNDIAHVLTSNYLTTSDSPRRQVKYMDNLLKVTQYAPHLQQEILSLILERLIKTDVEVQAEWEKLEEVDEDIEYEVAQMVLDLQNEDDEDDSDDESDIDEDEDSVTYRAQRLKRNMAAMDATLDRLFTYYNASFTKGSRNDTTATFDHLLTQFESTILPCYRSRHTQFLIFHFAQASPELIDQFVGACAHITFDRTRPLLTRLSAAAYLASFIARGARVSANIVRDVFEILGQNLDGLRARHEESCAGPDLRRYGAFYALSQALLYIFCFRWRDLLVQDDDEEMEDPDDVIADGRELNWAPKIRSLMTRLIYSKLNPLKVCSQHIVQQFAAIAQHLRFLYVYSLLETNKRLRLSHALGAGSAYSGIVERETALSGKREEEAFQLDNYFPFDPYRLPTSKRWIEGDYVQWKNPVGLRDDDDDEDSSDEDSEDDEEFEEETATEASN